MNPERDSGLPHSLSPGDMVGPYRVQGLLGRGGMGEVYRAHDVRLDRSVALKKLPESFSRDPGRRARLEREARVLASLNHPNIATLFGVEEAPAGLVLVMELVDGVTLADSVALGTRGTSGPLRDVLSTARQIAAALEAAHEHGVVHGDLTSSNVVVRPDGTVKVLDFGLSRTAAGEPDDAAPPADTVTAIASAPSVGPGTLCYMSPEQLQGQHADTRSDVWAFGCVLYELLTGRQAFAGKTPVEVTARILEREPDFSVLPSDTPVVIRRLLGRCLAKDTRERLRHIGDARLELDHALASDSERGADSPRTSGTRQRLLRAGGVAALMSLAGLTGWEMATRSGTQAPGAVTRLSIASLEAPFPTPFGEHHLAISADGSRIAYASASRLSVRRMDEKETVAIDVAASNPFFSPDGEWLAFFVRAGNLEKVPVRGGARSTIAAITGRPNGGAWRPDGTIVFSTSEGLYQVSDGGGNPRLLVRPDAARKERAYASPHFLPDGRSLLFTIVPEGPIEGAQIALFDLSTGARSVVLQGGSAARYIPAGYLLYSVRQALKVVPFDADARRTRGEPVTVPDVAVASAADNGTAEFDVSDRGTLVFIAPSASRPSPSVLAWVTRDGREEPLPLAPGRYLFPRVSPDGRKIAVDVPGANRDVWVWDLERRNLTRLTRGPAEDMLPTWSRNGRLFFASQRDGNFDLYSQTADGAAPEQVEFAGPGDQFPNGFTPDGTRLIVNENFKDLSVLTLTRPSRLDPLLHSDADEWLGDVSPDGKWIAYESNESGDRFEIYLRPFPDVGTRREKVSLEGGRYPLWSPHGTGELFYVGSDGAMMAVPISPSPTLTIGRATRLFDFAHPPNVITARPYDVSPVDGRFLTTRPAESGPSQVVDVTVVLNWFDELRQLVPRP